MDSLSAEEFYEWYHDDITWCGNDCHYTECERNKENMLHKEGIHSYALFKDTEMCPLKEKKNEKMR
jgi:hypothetical protein